MSDFHSKKASEIINRILYITIATVSRDGQPWNSPVYSAFDKDLNFYWFSDKDSQHSKNIRENKNVSLVLYDSTVPEGEGWGVYIEAEAYELSNGDEVLEGLKVMDNRIGKKKEREYEKFSGAAVLRVYKVIPQRVWVNDDEKDENGKYIRDIRVEISLDALKTIIEGMQK